jgi:general secretion pathway protein H
MPISFSNTRRRDQRGFTLIEIMVVVAIIAAVLAIGAPKLFNTTNQMRSAVRKLAVTTRSIRNVARLKNSTVRLVLNMEADKNHSYAVEAANGVVPLMSEEQEKELKKLTSSQRKDDEEKSKFEPETSVVKAPVSLPRGLFISNVEYSDRTEPITSGHAYIDFFPQGLSEESAIHLTDRKTLNWTITIHPLTGRAQVFERNISLKEITSQ